MAQLIHPWEALLNTTSVNIPDNVVLKGLELAKQMRRRSSGVEAADIVLRHIFADFEAEKYVCWKRVETIQFEPIRLSQASAMGIGLRLEGYTAAKELRQRAGETLSIIEREGAYYIDLSSGIGDPGIRPCTTWQDFHSSWRDWCFKTTGLNQYQLMEQAVKNALGGNLDGIQKLYDFQHRSGLCVKKLKQQMYFCTGRYCTGKRNEQFDKCRGAWCWTLGAKERNPDLGEWGFTGERIKFMCTRDSGPTAIPAHPLEACVQKAEVWATMTGHSPHDFHETLEEALFRSHFMETEFVVESNEPCKIAPWPSTQGPPPPRPTVVAQPVIAPSEAFEATARQAVTDVADLLSSTQIGSGTPTSLSSALQSLQGGYAVPMPVNSTLMGPMLEPRLVGVDLLGSGVGGTASSAFRNPSLVSPSPSPPSGLDLAAAAAACAGAAPSRVGGSNFGYPSLPPGVNTPLPLSPPPGTRVNAHSAVGSMPPTRNPNAASLNNWNPALVKGANNNNNTNNGIGVGRTAEQAWEIMAGLLRLTPELRAKLQEVDPKNNGKHDTRDQKRRIKEMKNSIIDTAYTQAPEELRNRIFNEMRKYAVSLAQHENGALVVASLFRQGRVDQQMELVRALAPEVPELAKHSEGTRVVQAAVDRVPPDQRVLLLAGVMEENKIMHVIGNPNAVFLLRSCLSLVVRELMHPEWVLPIVKTVSDRIKEIVDNKKTLQFSYKLVLWVVECSHRVQYFEAAKARILGFCSKAAKSLIDTKYGNILLRHALQFGSAEHRERIFEVAIESLKEVHDKRWYASHVIDLCADFVKDDATFNQELRQRFMQMVVQHFNYPDGRESPFERMFRSSNGKRTARRVYECVSEEYREILRTQIPEIENEELVQGSAAFDSTLFNDEYGGGADNDGTGINGHLEI